MRETHLMIPTADQDIFYPLAVTSPEQLNDPQAIIGVLLSHAESLEAHNAQLRIIRMTVAGLFGQPLLLIQKGQFDRESFWNLIKEGSFELLRRFAIPVAP